MDLQGREQERWEARSEGRHNQGGKHLFCCVKKLKYNSLSDEGLWKEAELLFYTDFFTAWWNKDMIAFRSVHLLVMPVVQFCITVRHVAFRVKLAGLNLGIAY